MKTEERLYLFTCKGLQKGLQIGMKHTGFRKKGYIPQNSILLPLKLRETRKFKELFILLPAMRFK